MIEKEHLACQLTDEEVSARENFLARLYSSLVVVEEEKADFAREYNERMKNIRLQMTALSKEIRSKHEFREVDIDIRRNNAERTVETVRMDTGELVRDRPMTPEEMQIKLFEDQAPGDTIDESLRDA